MQKPLLLLTLVTALTLPCRADTPGSLEPSQVCATWLLVTSKMTCTEGENTTEVPKGREKIKIISTDHFAWIEYEPATGKVLALAGGKCELKGNRYAETIQYTSQELSGMVGKTFVFEIKIQGDKLLQTGEFGEKMRLDEVWVRKTADKPTQLATVIPSTEK